MFGTYLRRELVNRRRQTIIIAIGMALAIALVIIVNSVSAGVNAAQASVLKSIYGVGTDITVTEPATATAPGTGGGGGGPFNFGANGGSQSAAGTTVHTSRLSAGIGVTTMSKANLAAAERVDNVAAAAGVLSLTNTTFNGVLPNFQQLREQGGGRGGGATQTAPTGGADGAGGSSFTVDSFSVLGVDPGGAAVGPLSATTLSTGKTFTAADTGKDVAVVDATYAKAKSLKVGDSLTVGGSTFDIIGTVATSGSAATTAANVYIPLDVAQTLSSETGKISSIYITAASSSDIGQIKTDLQKALPTATVSTEADLASTVSGSLGTAGQLVSNLGTWLSIIVLAAAFLIAILFTISGVTRRTREFGTLKAIGWSNRRIVGQVAGESVVQGLIGGIIGVILGIVGILIVNAIAPTLSSSVATGVNRAAGARTGAGARGAAGAGSGGGFGGGGFGSGGGARGGFGGAFRSAADTTSSVALHAPITFWIIVIAVGLAILGGIIAGVFGGWRASRLRPAAALRSVA